MHLFAFERVRYRSIGCVCARLTHDNPRIRPHETPDNQQLRGMEIALRARLNRTVTIARIALAHSSLAILSKFSIERISSKRNGQEKGENLQTTSLNGRFFRQQVSRFSQFPIGLHIFGCEFNIAMSFFVIIASFVKLNALSGKSIFFFFLCFHPSIRLTIDNLSREHHPILRNNFENRVFDFFFSLSNN